MKSTLQRRIKQLEKLVEQVTNPEKPQEVVLLATPAPGAPAQAVEKFRADMSAAIQRGAFAIVLAPLDSPVAVDAGDRVKIVRQGWEAQVEFLARTPSKTRAGSTALDDLLNRLPGNVIRPVQCE